jgi:hypothetical protein
MRDIRLLQARLGSDKGGIPPHRSLHKAMFLIAAALGRCPIYSHEWWLPQGQTCQIYLTSEYGTRTSLSLADRRGLREVWPQAAGGDLQPSPPPTVKNEFGTKIPRKLRYPVGNSGRMRHVHQLSKSNTRLRFMTLGCSTLYAWWHGLRIVASDRRWGKRHTVPNAHGVMAHVHATRHQDVSCFCFAAKLLCVLRAGP